MIEKFAEWLLDDVIPSVCDAVIEVALAAVVVIVVVVALPIWIIPFVFWYFTSWKRKEK